MGSNEKCFRNEMNWNQPVTNYILSICCWWMLSVVVPTRCDWKSSLEDHLIFSRIHSIVKKINNCVLFVWLLWKGRRTTKNGKSLHFLLRFRLYFFCVMMSIMNPRLRRYPNRRHKSILRSMNRWIDYFVKQIQYNIVNLFLLVQLGDLNLSWRAHWNLVFV